MDNVIQIINSVGFPIAMALLLFWQNTKTIIPLKQSIDNNTNVTQQTLELLKNIQGRLNSDDK